MANAELQMTSEQHYRRVQRMIHKLIHKYRPLVPEVDYDDLLGEAHVAFCIALREHNPARGTMVTWVYWRVRGCLTHLIRNRMRKRKRLTQHELNDQHMTPDDPVRVAAAMDGDAGVAARLVLQSPPMRPEELADQLAELGWSGERITTTFALLRKAVQ